MKTYLVLLTLLAMTLSTAAWATGTRDDGNDQRQDQDQQQDQDQSQEQDQQQDQLQDQSQSSEQANQQNLSIENRTPGRAYVGGGDSTASDQKVFAISGGWLTGAAGIRFDLTDKDARRLRVADQWREQGRIAAADQLTCSIRAINKAFGGASDCYNALAGSNTNVEVTRYSRRDNEQDSTIITLQRELELLREQVEQCDERTDAAFRKCVSK